MAEHGSGATHPQDYSSHEATYHGFLKGSIALTLMSLYVLVALVAFGFISTGNLLIGFGGLIIGSLALVIDLRAGGKWYVSTGWLVIFALITAVMLG